MWADVMVCEGRGFSEVQLSCVCEGVCVCVCVCVWEGQSGE